MTIQIGEMYRFNHDASSGDTQTHDGSTVRVLDVLLEESPNLTRLYCIEDVFDGWIGYAWADELAAINEQK